MQTKSRKKIARKNHTLRRQVTVRVSEEMFNRMEAAAEDDHREIADWIRVQAIRPALDRPLRRRKNNASHV